MLSISQMRRKMQYVLPFFVIGFAAIFIIGAFTMYGSGAGMSSMQPAGGVFAKLGREEISNDAFAGALRQQQQQMEQFGQFTNQRPSLDQLAQAPGYAYQQLLNEFAGAAAARQAGIDVSESEAGETARKLVDERLKQLAEGATTREELAGYRRNLMSQIDLGSLRRQLAVQRLREKLQAEAHTNEVRVAHVLIKPAGGKDWSAALKTAQDVARQARAGAKFEELVKKYSEDEGSKVGGGLVGWASAMPAASAPDPKKKPAREPAGSFVEEFTAASLGLKPGQVSDPVRTTFGYHVIKALELREYQPDADAAKDTEKRNEAMTSYRQQVADRQAQAMINREKQRIEVELEARSPWLRGYLAEQASLSAAAADPKKPAQNPARTTAIAAYQEALEKNDPAAGAALAYRLAKLLQETGQHAEALKVLDLWAERSGDANLYYLRGVSQKETKQKTEAVASLNEAIKRSYDNPLLLEDISNRLAELGRRDLAAAATKQAAKQRKRQEELLQKRQAEMLQRQAEQTAAAEKAAAEAKAKTGSAAPAKPAPPAPPAAQTPASR